MRNNRNFKLILIGQIISLFGNAIQRFALSLYILDITGNSSIYANILALSIVPYIILAPIAGNIADNYNKKYMMILLDIIAGILMIICFILFIFKLDSTFLIAIVMLLLSTISVCYEPVVTSSIPQTVDIDYLQKANSYISQSGSWANILGPILGGILYGFLGIKLILIINGLSFLISAILECFIKFPKHQNTTYKSLNPLSAFIHMKNTLKTLSKNYKIILGIILSYGLYNISIVPIISVLFPTIINLNFNMPPQVYGILESIIASGLLISGVLINLKSNLFKFKTHYKWNYLMPLSMFLVGTLLIISNNINLSMLGITIGGFIIMFCLGIGNIITLTYIQTVVPKNILGSVSALSTAIATASIPIGQVSFGYLIRGNLNIGLILVLSSIIAFFVCSFVKLNIKNNYYLKK
ncbi:MFS transporter [Candidatus Arthromitus sp. SFB-rat-Yit]|uniref:MFS transporter n=1 Tax=Candidatus Arthromitus sp. SFB-rat-Yit TaxID=1041504 RepID=UPI000227A48E|nr:MFS transporter [Candidatus Arthromitus sp. SFB-rat-Yit]BAK81554.1 major facilitator transporter [Candidatus Arthromitus sp. SFB-rat-Yit]